MIRGNIDISAQRQIRLNRTALRSTLRANPTKVCTTSQLPTITRIDRNILRGICSKQGREDPVNRSFAIDENLRIGDVDLKSLRFQIGIYFVVADPFKLYRLEPTICLKGYDWRILECFVLVAVDDVQSSRLMWLCSHDVFLLSVVLGISAIHGHHSFRSPLV